MHANDNLSFGDWPANNPDGNIMGSPSPAIAV
jgi:hypothetical protein